MLKGFVSILGLLLYWFVMTVSKENNTLADDESLSNIIKAANDNSEARLSKNDWISGRLTKIDDLFKFVVGHLDNPNPIAPAFFLPRCHSAFIGSVRLAAAGQVAESFPVSRLALENSIYAYFVNEQPDSFIVWASRGDSEAAKKESKGTFVISRILDSIFEKEPSLGGIVKELYDFVIDYGSHPNPQGHFSNMKHSEAEKKHTFYNAYLTEDGIAISNALKTSARVALAGLELFQKIYKVRFELLQIDKKILTLKKGLLGR